jgi:hypothetical protein
LWRKSRLKKERIYQLSVPKITVNLNNYSSTLNNLGPSIKSGLKGLNVGLKGSFVISPPHPTPSGELLAASILTTYVNVYCYMGLKIPEYVPQLYEQNEMGGS